MICKSCGATIPGQLLRKDSFSCPSCGKIYRRNSEKSRNAPSGRSENPVPIRQNMPSRKRFSMDMPGWLLPVTAGIAVIALVLCIVLLIKGTGGARLSGAFSTGKISANKSVTRTIGIPRQSNTRYIIAAESDTVGVTVAIKNKTQTYPHSQC